MEIRYTNTLGDLVRFNLYHVPRMRVIQALLAALLVVHLATFGRDIYALPYPLSVRILSIVVSIAIVFAILAILGLTLFVLSYRPSRNKVLFTDHVLRIAEEGIVEETPLSSSTFSWSAIPKIAQNRRYVFVYVQENAAHVVPKRVFPSPEDAAAFYESIQAHVSPDRGGRDGRPPR